MAKSSIHFEKTDASFAKKHNSREEEPTYLLPKEFWQGNIFEEKIPSEELRKLYDEQIKIRRENHARGSTPTLKSSQTEAVINLNKKHTLDDVKRVAAEIEKRYGFKTVSLAIHRDEGHLESRNGKVFPVYNYHAHVVFFTLKDGISMRRKLGSKELEEANTLTAELLGMERGESKTQRWERVADMLAVTVEEIRRKDKSETPKDYVERIAELAKSKGFDNFNIYDEVKPKKRLSAKEFRQVAKEKSEIKKEYSEKIAEVLYLNEKQKKKINDLEEEKTVLSKDKEKLNSELLTLKEQKAQIEIERKKYKAEGDHLAEEYRKLQALNKTKHTQEELNEALAELRQQYEQRIKAQTKEITDLKEEKTVLSNSNKALEEKLDDYTVLYNNSIHEQNLAKTDFITEVIDYDRENYGREESYNRQDYDREQFAMYDLSERSMATAGIKFNDLRMSLYSFKNKELSAQSDTSFCKKCDFLYELSSKAKFVNNGFIYQYDQWQNAWQESLKFHNQHNKPKEIVKTVEVVKEVPREITTTDVENHVRFKALQQEKDNQEKYYKELLKPDMTDLKFNFLTVQDLEELKPKTTKKVLGMPFKEETPQAVVARYNKILERRNEDVRRKYQNIKYNNTVLSNDNDKLKAENEELKSWKEIGLTLLHNVGYFLDSKIPSIEDVKSTVKSFTSRLFSAFIMNNDHDIDFVQTKIVDGQEFKQAQIEKQQQIEQQRREERQKQKERWQSQEQGGMSL